ncbi:unnamed protein product [Umbelopsis vinacea]
MPRSPSPYARRDRDPSSYRDLDQPGSRSPPRYRRRSRSNDRGYRDRSRSVHRSRSPPRHSRDRVRDRRSPDRRDRNRDRHTRNVSRSRSRSPVKRERDGDRSRRRGDNDDRYEGRPRHEKEPEAMHQDEQDNAPAAADDDDDPEAQMMKLMGFGGFETTKGKHVAGADMSGANVKKQPKYRQYMNRRGGFNRPLDKV